MTEKSSNQRSDGSNQWIKFFSKTLITIAIGIILTPASAIMIGSTTYLVADRIKDNIEDEEAKEVFNFISICGEDVVKGGILGGAVGTLINPSSSNLISKGKILIGNKASK